jgi:hypothetical protein
MDPQLLEKALEASGDDLDSAIKSLNELRLESTGFKSENGQHTVIQPSVEGCFPPKTLVFLRCNHVSTIIPPHLFSSCHSYDSYQTMN